MKKCLFVCLFICFGSANASILDFEDQSGLSNYTDIGNTYIKGDFKLTTVGTFHVYTQPGCCSYQGSTALDNHATLSKTDNSAFNFSSIDLTGGTYIFDYIGMSFRDETADYAFTGIFSGGGSITQTVTVDGYYGFQHYAFSGFSNVQQVSWINTRVGGPPIGLQFDNINVASAASAVPEPATMALLGIGLAGIGFARKKQAA